MKTYKQIKEEVLKECEENWVSFCKERNLNPNLEPKSNWVNMAEELKKVEEEVDKKLFDQLEDGADDYNDDPYF